MSKTVSVLNLAIFYCCKKDVALGFLHEKHVRLLSGSLRFVFANDTLTVFTDGRGIPLACVDGNISLDLCLSAAVTWCTRSLLPFEACTVRIALSSGTATKATFIPV